MLKNKKQKKRKIQISKKFLKTCAKDAPNYPDDSQHKTFTLKDSVKLTFWLSVKKIMHIIHFFLQKTWTLGQNGRIGRGIRAVLGIPLYLSKEVVFRAFPGAIAI